MSKEQKPAPKVSAIDIYRYYLRVAFSFRWPAIINVFIIPITVIVERYLAPLIIAYILNGIQQGTVTLSSTMWLLVSYASIQLFTQLLGYRLSLFTMWTVQVKGAKKIYDDIYDKLTGHSLNFFHNQFVGSMVSQVNKTINAYINFWSLAINKILFVITTILATIIGLAFVMWPLALIMLVLTIVFMVAAIYGMRFMRPRFVARSESYSKISGALSDSIGNIFTVKMDGMETHERRNFQKHSQHVQDTELHTRNGFVAVSSFYSFIIALMRIGALVASVAAIEYSAISAGLVYICLTYTFNLIEEIWNFNDIIRDHHQIVSDSQEMQLIMQQPHEVKDISSKVLDVPTGAVSLRDVAFTHADSHDVLFNDFNLRIPAGQKLGIVGVSGSGKTTLTKLLMRFMDVDSGAITVDRQNIAEVSQKSLHCAIGYVPQEPLLFHRSLSENISYSKPRATPSDIVAAAKKAHIHEFIESLPDGYDTLVGERGVKLSGGQRQRIAIARAILKDAPILVLDEATSALDSESEKLIQQSLGTLMKNRTSIVIAHRLSTIAKLDRIIVLEKGVITEDGTHEKLLKMKGTYAKLWAHQSGGFIEE